MTAPLDELVIAVSAVGLPGSLRELPGYELPEQQARELVEAAERQHLAGVTLASAQAGDLRLPPSAFEALADVHVREMTTCLRLEYALLVVTALLDEAGIESRVLDGSAVAHLDYQDPALRTFPQLDLLMRPGDIVRAVHVLRRDGWQPAEPETGRRRSESVTSLTGPDQLRLDLHTTLDRAPGELTVDIDELWSEGQEFVLGERRLTALDSEHRLLDACCRAVTAGSHPPPLVIERDIAEMVLFGGWKHGRLMKLASAWRAQAVLAQAVRSAWQHLAIADVTTLSVWAQGYRPPGRQQRPRRLAVTAGGPSLRSWARLFVKVRRP
jgi:hypothetical protein